MSFATKESIAFLMFAGLFAGVIVAEVLWLVRQGWATNGRAVAFVLVTDLLSFCVAAFFSFLFGLLMLMLVLGPQGAGPTQGSEPAMWTVLIAALLFPPIGLFFIKRAFLAIFGLSRGRTAWFYSAAVALLILAVVLVPPSLFVYFA